MHLNVEYATKLIHRVKYLRTITPKYAKVKIAYVIHGFIVAVKTKQFLFVYMAIFVPLVQTNVQRGCISTISSEYQLMKQMIGHRDKGCVKRMRTFDCFTFCSQDVCN